MSAPYRLYYAPDNASLCVRLALLELGQPFETTLVDRQREAQKTADYLALNPNGLIPVLETPDGPIFETAAILLWLADRHGALAPSATDPDRAGFLSWLFWMSNTLHAALRERFYAEKYLPGAPDLLRDATQERISASLDLLTRNAPSKWLDADRASLLTCYLAPQLRWLALFPVGHTDWYDLQNWPRLFDLAQSLERRPAFAAAAQAEGLGPTPFSNPTHAIPPEGSAT